MIRLITFISLLGTLLTAYAGSMPTVQLSTTNWPPYVASDIKGYGYIYGIVNSAFQAGGYNTAINFLPWIEAKELDQRHFDAYFPEYDGSGTESVVCSDPMQGGPVGLYRRQSQPIKFLANPSKDEEAAFNDLKAYRFGVVSGYKNTQVFDNSRELIKIPANDDLDNLRHLHDNKVDLVFIDIFVAEYLINKHHPEFADLVFMGPSIENKKLYVCFSRKAPDYVNKLAAFNRGLKELKDSGRLAQIMEQYQF